VDATDLIPRSVGGNIGAVESDFLLLFKNNSTLPVTDIGQGVFAKHSIPAKSVICEYRGPIVAAEDYTEIVGDNKAYSILGPDEKDYKILGENICAFINDCTSATDHAISFDGWQSLNLQTDSSGIPCYEGFSYNAKFLSDHNGKVFVLSNRLIHPGEEIFVPYGWYFIAFIMYDFLISYKTNKLHRDYWSARVDIDKDGKLHHFLQFKEKYILVEK
jgi:hypothetical protein